MTAPISSFSLNGWSTTLPPSIGNEVLNYRWVSPTYDNGNVEVSTNTTNGGVVRLRVITPIGSFYTAPVTPNARGDAVHVIANGTLTRGTIYTYRVVMNSTEDAKAVIGRIVYAPNTATSFSFCFGSCGNATSPPVFTTMRARNDPLFLHLGDLYYADDSGQTVDNYRARFQSRLASSTQEPMYASASTAYVPSDHDGAMTNDGDGSLFPAAFSIYNQVYREKIPSTNLPGSDGVYQTFAYGRVRFIMLDTRSLRTARSAPDNSSKSMLGTVQKQWLKDVVTAATESLIFIGTDVPWAGATTAGQQHWGGYNTERVELGNFLNASGKAVVFLSGDMHAVAWSDGIANGQNIYNFAAAPFVNNSSIKGGPWNQLFPASGTTSVSQYGRVQITDTGGSSVTAQFTGYDTANTELVSVTKTFTVSVSTSTPLPIRGAFYYPWFTGGSAPYRGAWTQGSNPWTQYHPKRGYYDSASTAVIDQHIGDLVYGKFDAMIVSWWGPSSKEDNLIDTILARLAASGTGLKLCLYYEMEGNTVANTPGSPNPSSAQIATHLDYITTNYTSHANYLHVNNKPVIFVYGGPEDEPAVTTVMANRTAARWYNAVQNTLEPWYTNLKVYGGYATDQATYPSDSWHQYGPASPVSVQGSYARTISPRFWRGDNAPPYLPEISRATWQQNIRNMEAGAQDWKLVTSYNEWGEGHSVEAATGPSSADPGTNTNRVYAGTGWDSSTGYGWPLDDLASNGILGPTAVAGPDAYAEPNEEVFLNGSSSSGPAGISSFAWSQTSGSPTVPIYGSGAQVSFYAPAVLAGVDLTFTLTVTDASSVTATDTVTVHVAPPSLRKLQGGTWQPVLMLLIGAEQVNVP